MNRKTFIKSGITTSLGIGLLPSFAIGNNDDEPVALSVPVVKEFVIAGHKNIDRVKEMLGNTPNLIYSRYDWGNGDFEEAIEGAGHLGNKEIANYLIGQGARVNLFVLTMLGKTELVKPVLEAYPNLVFAKGPHGFTLLHHANVGGEDSLELSEYLKEKGLIETNIKIR